MALEKVSYAGWSNNVRLANDKVELIITADVGPRIIRFGFMGGQNEFAEFPGQVGKLLGDDWRLYGGHRLWHAPEDLVRTYHPDNDPVTFEEHAGFLRVIQPVEPRTGVEKQLDITLSPDSTHVHIVHRLINHNLWPVELSVWALSVMGSGGTAIYPLGPRGHHPQDLVPNNSLSVFPFTNMSDPRWTWGRKYILLRQQPNTTEPQKIGINLPDAWAAYARNNHLFVKTYNYVLAGNYPDLGSSVETFTNADMLEVETLSPLVKVAPAASVEHIEDWYLFDNVPVPANDADVDRSILPLVQSLSD